MKTGFAFANAYNHLCAIDIVSEEEEMLYFELNKIIKSIVEENLNITKELDSLMYFVSNDLADFINKYNEIGNNKFYIWFDGSTSIKADCDYSELEKLSEQVRITIESFIYNIPEYVDKSNTTIIVFEFSIIIKDFPIAVF